ALHILDAVYGMEGDGPTNGNPKFIGKLIASPNPYLVDIAGVSLFADPKSMPLIKKAVKRGIISEDFSECEFDLKKLNKEYIEDFKRVKVFSINFTQMPKWFAKFIRNSMSPKVKPLKRICKGCQKCFHHCPAKAITMMEKIAVVDQSKCIRCYCCQELCPYNAIKLRKPIVYRVARLFSKGKTVKKTKK
ncbi:MAG TPA: 4Fe-4S binding protein, partial [Eubacteriales bacterium]|nr:4Fe-4S binding protein [Eubacteriales bacterium]